MARPIINTAEKLEIQLRKHLNRCHLYNVVLHPSYSHSGLPPGQTFLADVIDKTGASVPFTESGFLAPGHRFVSYSEIERIHWISKNEDLPAIMTDKKDKREVFDWLEFELSDGSSMVLKNLDKAVFPLLSFFQWLLREREEHDDIDKRESKH